MVNGVVILGLVVFKMLILVSGIGGITDNTVFLVITYYQNTLFSVITKSWLSPF